MRQTNREKYENYRLEIEAKDRQAIAALLPSVPTQFYTINAYETVAVEVTSVGVYRRGIYQPDESNRMTRDQVALAKKYLDEWAAPTLKDISVHYRHKQAYGTVSGAHRYQKIEEDAGMAWRAEDLADEIERRRMLYAPRDGHTACAYCRKQTPTANLVSHTIHYRDRGGLRKKVGQYCSGQCGYYDQCGHEG
jgi:hypothetical protein